MSAAIPVSIEVTPEPLDLAAGAFGPTVVDPATGAVVTFTGLMRDLNDGDRVEHMRLEHYPGMTEKALREIADAAIDRWVLQRIRIVHRVGELRPTDPIVFVAVASAHRGDAFAACAFLMDFLKTRAPFWKHEQLVDGSGRWVAARDSDTHAAERWTERASESEKSAASD